MSKDAALGYMQDLVDFFLYIPISHLQLVHDANLIKKKKNQPRVYDIHPGITPSHFLHAEDQICSASTGILTKLLNEALP